MTTLSLTTLPSLLTEMHTVGIPVTYRRFAALIGAEHWRHHVGQINAAIKGNPYIAEHAREEHSVAFALARCGDLLAQYGRLPDDPAVNRRLYPAMAFASQVLSMVESSGPIEGERMVKRVRDAIENPVAMRGISLELGVATHFAHRGHTLQWPEMVGAGNFDLLVTDLGTGGLEVECKAISTNKGRKIHRDEALALHRLLIPELETIRQSMMTCLAIVLTVPGRLPSHDDARAALALRVVRQVYAGRSASLDDGSDLRIVEFAPSRMDPSFATDESLRRAFMEDVSGTKNREGVLLGGGGRGAIVFVVQSADDDQMLDETFATLKDAAKRQLTHKRPGIVIAGFDGMTSQQLISIAQQDNDPQQPVTELMRHIQPFLGGKNRTHVVGVGFLSRSDLAPEQNGFIESGGAAYFFPNRTSPLWSDDLSGLFNRQTAPANGT